MSEQVFDTYLEGIQDAMVQVQRGLRAQFQPEFFERYFEKQADGSYKPVTVRIHLPKLINNTTVDANKDGQADTEIVEVPLVTLIPARAIQLTHMRVRFKIRINGAKEDVDKKGRKRRFLQVDHGGGVLGLFKRKTQLADVEVNFRGADPPEGWVRIDNQLRKVLP